MMKNKRKPLMLLLATLCVTAVSGMTACFDKPGSSQEETSSMDSSTESVSTDVEDSSSMVESEESSSSVADEESSSAGDSEDSSSSVVEKVAPTITFASDVTNLVGNVGETVEIPKVIVESEEEYGLLVMLADATTKGIVFEEKAGDAGTYLLTSDVAGDIRIGYIAYLTEDDTVESQEIVTVKINPVKAETVVPEEEGLGEYPTAVAKINAAEEGETVVFTENFEKGYGSQFTAWTEYSHTNSAGSPTPYLTATEDAITGNSWVLDYTGLKRTGESMIFTELGSIIRQGAWKIEFDVRALSGSLNKNAQFCIFPVGQDVAYRWEFAVTSEVTHVTIDIGTKNFIDANSAAFNVGSDDYSNLKIVLDNFRVTYTKVTYPVSEPEGMQVRLSADENWKNTELSEAEVVIDGNNGGTWSSLSGSGSPVWVDRDALKNTSIITEEQKQAMTAENGFGDNVIYLIGQNNLIEAFVGGFTMQNFYKGDQIAYKMRIEMKVIGSTNGWTFLVGGQGVATTVEGDGIVKTVIWEGVPTSAFQEVWFYNGGVNELFVGEIKVTREEVIDARVNPDNLVTAETNWVDNKIVLNTTADNLTAITPSSASFAESGYVDRNKIVGAKIMSSGEYDKAFAADSGFAADSNVPVLFLNGSQTIWFNALDNLFTDVSGAYSYRITISGYVLSASNWHLWRSNSGTSYGQFGDGANKFFTETKTITPTEDFTQCGLYVGGNLKAFISSIVVERIPTVTVTPNNLVKNAEWADNKIVLNTTADNLTAYEAVDQTVGISYVDVTKLVAAGRMDQATYEANFTAKNGFNTEIPVLYIVGNGMMSFSALDGLFKNEDKNYEYKITVKGFAVTASNCHLFHDVSWGSFGQMADTTNGMFNETFDLSTGYDRLGFYAGGSMELYIASIEVVRTKIEVNPNVTPENLVSQAEWADNKIVLNTTNSNLTAYTDHDGRCSKIGYVDASKLVDAGMLDQATFDSNFTVANGYNAGVPVFYAKGSGFFYFNALDGLFAEYEGYTYKVTIKGYAAFVNDGHMFTKDTWSSVKQFGGTESGYAFSETFDMPTGHPALGILGNQSIEIYVFSLEVERTKVIVNPNVTPENLLTKAEWADNKIVLNTTADNLTAFKDADGRFAINYVDTSKLAEAGKLDQATLDANFTAANGFNTAIPVLHVKGGGAFWFSALDGLFAKDEGYTYSLTIKGYAVQVSNSHLWSNNGGVGKQIGDTSNGYAFNETISLPIGINNFGFYAGGSMELYIASVEVVRTEKVVPEVDVNVTPENLLTSAEWVDNKIVLNTTNSNLTAIEDWDNRYGNEGNSIGYVDASKLVEAGKMDQATFDNNFTAANGYTEGVPVFYVKGTGLFLFKALDNLLNDSAYTYQMTIKGYAVNNSYVLLFTHGNWQQIGQFGDTSTGKVVNETFTFDAIGSSSMGINGINNIEMYIFSIEVVRIAK